MHAGLVPEWTRALAAKLAREVEAVLRDDARTLFDAMYGNKPDQWSDQPARHGPAALRHQRVHAHALLPAAMAPWISRLKGAPGEQPEGLLPWFDVPGRKSARGARDLRPLVDARTASDGATCWRWIPGCVWGGALTAVNLDDEAEAIQLRLRRHIRSRVAARG